MSHIGVGITHTVGESCVPQVLAEYCNQTPGVHINIVTDTIKNLYDMMRSYELDVASWTGSSRHPATPKCCWIPITCVLWCRPSTRWHGVPASPSAHCRASGSSCVPRERHALDV